MSAQYYPPPPNGAGTGAPQQKSYPLPPVSPPATQTRFYPPPPQQQQQQGKAYPSPPQQVSSPTPNPNGAGNSYPSPLQQHPQQHFSPPPQQQFSPPPQQQFSLPPQVQQPPLQQQQQQRQFSPPPQQMSIPVHTRRDSAASAGPQPQPPPQQFAAPPAYASSGGLPEGEYPADEEKPQPSPGVAPPLDTSNPVNLRSGAPPAGHFVGAGVTVDDVGTFNGGSYRISHRDCNTILTIQLAVGCPLTAKPGTMIAMSPSITLRGQYKFSMKKLVVGGEMGHSTLTGPGELLLGPPMLGDITSIRLTGNETWSVGLDGYLASTQGVTRDYKRQGIGKAMFSGEGLFVHKIGGVGLLWLTSFGAIIRKDLVDGEKYIVDNGHLVAWNTKYVLERVASGGIMSSLASAEGLVCKFTGPGTVFIQTRNARAFSAFMSGNSATTVV